MTIDAVVAAVAARLPDPAARGPSRVLVGVAGAVAVGKSTLAADLCEHLARADVTAEVVETDRFLYPNSVLAERGHPWRKGFPDSYDADALVALLDEARDRSAELRVPVYSHDRYDIVPGEVTVVDPSDVLVVEGVNTLQEPMRPRLDVGIYIDAAELDVISWFSARFATFCREAAADPDSFYRAFAHLGDDAVSDLARETWAAVNGPNLHEHILPTRAGADVVVHKGADHRITRVEVVGREP